MSGAKNEEHRKRYDRERMASVREADGGAANRKRVAQWRRDNPERSRANGRRARARLRTAVLEAYGGVCQCCGEDDTRFLTLDHVNGDGAAHRKRLGGSDAIWRELRRQGWPAGYETLCWNCNCGRQWNGGICPHKDPEEVNP